MNYIEHKLLKEVNQVLFRGGYITSPIVSEQQLAYLQIKEETSLEDRYLVTDYYEYKTSYEVEFCSKIAKGIQKIFTRTNTKLKRSINYTSNVTKEVIDILKNRTKEPAICGGFIRDSIANRKSKDVDFVCDTPYDELKEIFKENNFSIKETGKHFLILMVTKDDESFEIANYRCDGVYSDGKPTGIIPCNKKDDAQRRDFTINSLFFNLNKNIVEDFSGKGIDDCINKQLRFIGNPKDRLEEDGLRVLRAYRFIDNGYTTDGKTLSAIRSGFEHMCKNTSASRIRIELEKIVKI